MASRHTIGYRLWPAGLVVAVPLWCSGCSVRALLLGYLLGLITRLPLRLAVHRGSGGAGAGLRRVSSPLAVGISACRFLRWGLSGPILALSTASMPPGKVGITQPGLVPPTRC